MRHEAKLARRLIADNRKGKTMTDNVAHIHRPLTQYDWKFIFDVLEGTKLDVPHIRSEVTRLHAALAQANSQAERFEREWYLRGDALEKIEAGNCIDPRTVAREALWPNA